MWLVVAGDKPFAWIGLNVSEQTRQNENREYKMATYSWILLSMSMASEGGVSGAFFTST